MTEHELKTWPHEWDAVARGEKTFELRNERDRSFEVGDTLLLVKWDPASGYVGRNGERGTVRALAVAFRVRVTYVLHGGRFGLPSGMCVMSISADPICQRPAAESTGAGAGAR